MDCELNNWRKRTKDRVRRKHGQVATALNLFLGLLIVGALAIFSFELSRILLAREQLKSCVDIAALSGEATLLSSTQSFAAAQSNAKQTALNMFRRNSILGSLMTGVTEVASPSMLSPGSGEAQVYFEFVDPVSGVVGGPNSNVLRVTGAYSYQIFGGAVYGMGNTVYTVAVATKASLPALDLYVLMDISASMDDQTPVTYVLRKWDPAGNGGVGAPAYSIPTGGPGGNGPISIVGCSAPMGNATNGMEPQHLNASQANYALPCDKCFSEIVNKNNPGAMTEPLRGLTDSGAPPGDAPIADGGTTLVTPSENEPPQGYPLAFKFKRKKMDDRDPFWQRIVASRKTRSNRSDRLPWDTPASAQGPSSYDDCTFTHLVVNLDGNPAFGSHSQLGYNFPTLGSLVEASVGNLDSAALASAAKLDLGALGVTPEPQYRDAYRIIAASRIEPLYSAESSVAGFLNKVRYTTDPHFGFIAFSSFAGNAPTDTVTDYKVSWAYPQGGMAQYPLPGIHVDPTPGVNNFDAITNAISIPGAVGPSSPLIAVQAGTNTAQAMVNALSRLDPNSPTASTRTGAARAIILVTDGLPTYDLTGTAYTYPGNGPAQADALSQAAAARAAGIPVFVVAINQDGSLASDMDNFYSDTNAGGVAYTSGNGAKYYRVNWSNPAQTKQDMDAVFGNIARQLVNLVR